MATYLSGGSVGRLCFLVYSDCWQISVPCYRRTAVSDPLVVDHSLLSTRFSGSQLLSTIFEVSKGWPNPSQVFSLSCFLFNHISLTLSLTRDVKGFSLKIMTICQNGPIWIIQEHIPISKSKCFTTFSKSLLPSNIIYSRVPGVRVWISGRPLFFLPQVVFQRSFSSKICNCTILLA